MTATEAFAEWGLTARIPGEPRRAARRHLLDGIGCALGARGLRSEVPALRLVSGGFGTHLIGGGEGGRDQVARANGNLIHALDFDDTHAGALVHVTAAVAPAALASAEVQEADWSDLVDAFVVGAEVVARIGAVVTHGFHRRGFHATAVTGVFASVVAIARLRGLDRTVTTHALGIAGSLAAGSLEFLADGASTKQLHPGLAAGNALLAVDLAVAGATGPSTILEGDHGIFRAYVDEAVTADRLTDGLGDRWEVEAITLKPYPLCQLSHASLDALAGIGPLDADEVETIEVTIPEGSVDIVAEPRDKKVRPRSEYEAKFSVQWDLAARLIDGHIDAATFADHGFERDDVASLAERVRVISVPDSGPPASAPGMVAVRLSDGTTRVGEAGASRGTPTNPLTDDELVAKFRRNATRWGADTDACVEAVLRGGGTVTDVLKTTRIAT